MTLEDRASVLIANWLRLASKFKLASEEPASDEHALVWKECLERCANELDTILRTSARERGPSKRANNPVRHKTA